MAKRKPLVSQHLENISRDALEKYQNIVRRYIRRRQGVYALYRRGKLYFVPIQDRGIPSNGLAASIHKRNAFSD